MRAGTEGLVGEGAGRRTARRRASGGYPLSVASGENEGDSTVVGEVGGEGGGGVMLPVGVEEAPGGGLVAVLEGSDPAELEPPAEEGAVGVPAVLGVSSGAVVSDPVGVPLGGRVMDGETSGEERPVMGSGDCGRSLFEVCGSRNRPMLIPATASTEPAAFCAERIRRRARTPVMRRSRCPGSKGVCCSVSRIIRANSRSK
ncbi:hypothetical protein ACFRDV_22440 [Streptomyces fagopyri]|uniref:hypothetical protein n=1 Tax=Streptomyces fagopyri TaxID=2662397 RepID=UPI003689E7C7